MKFHFRLILASVLVTTSLVARPETTDPKADALLAGEKEISKQRMMRIYDAIQTYRKEHHEFPRFLSELYPKYLSDTNDFLCPTAVRLHQELLPFQRDPNLRTHFGYSFPPRPVQVGDGSPPISMAEWKRMQMMVIGEEIPLVRCYAYEPVLNVTFDGKFVEGQYRWELDQLDKIKPGELDPANLRARVLADLGVELPAPTGFVELTTSDAAVSAWLSAGVHPVRQPRDIEAVKGHLAVDEYSWIPMSVEFVLKLLERVPLDYYEMQHNWHNRMDGTFEPFDGKTIEGVKFRRQFGFPRDENFPLNQLFGAIESELEHGRYVIISLPVSDASFHMWVVHSRLPSGEFLAVSKQLGARTITTSGVQSMVRRIHGTDILTYELTDSSKPRP